MKGSRLFLSVVLMVLLSGVAPGAKASGAEQDSAAVPAPVDYMWVLRGSLANRAGVDSVIVRATRMGVRGVLVQVVGRGDACYRSDVLPRAEFIDRNEGPDFDPFGELVAQAHAAGIEVHAWVNCLLVWSSRSVRAIRGTW